MRTWWQPESTTKLAIIFAVFGLLAGAGAAVFPGSRTTLFILYWTFLFAAVLLWFLTPERRVRVVVNRCVYEDIAANEIALVAAYDLRDTQVYIPAEGYKKDPPAWLFVPRHTDFDLPDDNELESLLVTSETEERRGLSLRPSGGRLFREFESMLSSDLSESPDELSMQLADGITEGLELADRVSSEVRLDEDNIVFEIENNIYGAIDQFDHPVQSFLAVGLAIGLDRPIITETMTVDDDPFIHVVTCHLNVGHRTSSAEPDREPRSALSSPDQ